MGWPAALFGTLATAACLGVTLYGGLGTIASGGDTLRAEKVKTSGSVDRDRATLKRLTAEREALAGKFVATDADAVKAAQQAADTATRTRARECPESDPRQRGNNCRMRESEEKQQIDALALAKSNKARTDQAAKLDSEIAKVTDKLDTAPPVVGADPQASTFSQLTGFSVDTSAALYAFLFSIALETAAMFAMMVAYSTPSTARREEPEADASATIAAPMPSTPRLVSDQPKAGSVPEIMANILTPAKRRRVELGEVFGDYAAECQRMGARVLTPEQFTDPAERFCRECGIRTLVVGDKIFLLDVALITAKRTARDDR
jgi:hypothetical protein